MAPQSMPSKFKHQVLLPHHRHCFFLQLKIDEFESNVNEVKDPYPSADFPGKDPEPGLEHGAVKGAVR